MTPAPSLACRGAARRSGSGAALALVALALACAPSAGAQQPEFQTAPGASIETKPLAPLTPASPGEASQPGQGTGTGAQPATGQGAGTGAQPGQGTAARDSRFKPAPFTTPEAPAQPQPIPRVDTVLMPGAKLRELDKMTGETRTVEVAAGKEIKAERLRIRLDACRAPQDNSEHGTIAFLQIWDTRKTGADPEFSGWMFAESPSLSAMDDPRYDVWVISCTTASTEASSASR